MTTLKVGIVGFGRFGRFWGKTLKNVCQVHVYDKDSSLEQVATSLNLTFDTLETLCTKVDYIFLCVPINQLESSIQQILPLVHPRISIIDTCSVKVYPAQILDKYFSQQNEISLILTHPMFGPDSGAVSISGLPVVFWPLRTVGDAAMRIRELFLFLGLRVVDMSPEEHSILYLNKCFFKI